MPKLLRALALTFLILGLSLIAAASSGYFARLFVDGVEVASEELAAGSHDVRVLVDGPDSTLLDETFQVEVPGSQHLVIDSDVLVENEVMTLRAGDTVEFRNHARLMIGEGASVDWQGTPSTTWSGQGGVQNLERDVEIFGEGDIMFAAGSQPSVIRYVEIDLRPLQETGHYPLHWHLVGDGSRGTLVEGVVVKNSPNRAYVPHGSHGITFRDVIAKDIVREAFWWDAPGTNGEDVDATHDVLYDHVLVDGVVPAEGTRGLRLGGFELGQGTENTVRNSVALNVVGDHKGSGGFVWPELNSKHGTVWTFENNRTFGNAHFSVFVWQNGADVHLVDDLVGDKPVLHGAYGNHYHYRNPNVPGFEVWAVNWQITGGSIGDVIDTKHNNDGPVTFTDVLIDSLTIDNPSPNPAYYTITTAASSTFGCDDVIWIQGPVGTSVNVDGVDCPVP